MNCYLALSLFLYFLPIASYVIYPHSSKHRLNAEDCSVMGCDSPLSGDGQVHQKCFHFWLISFALAIFTIDHLVQTCV